MSLTPKPRQTTTHKKRQAGHHRHSKGYLNTYWPYIPMIVIVGMGIFVNGLMTNSQAVLGTQSNFSNSTFLSITNKDRLANKENSLALSSQLSAAAEAKAADMVKDNYWSHTSPSGKTAQDFIIDSGYQFQAARENLAYGFNSASSVMSAWMNSPEHRANVLGTAYKDVGFGVAEGPNYLGKGAAVIVVAEYGEPSSVVIAPATVKQPPIKSVSRFQTVASTGATWPEAVLILIIVANVVIILVKHSMLFRKLAVESETYIIKHPLLDTSFVLIATVAALLSRTRGIIG